MHGGNPGLFEDKVSPVRETGLGRTGKLTTERTQFHRALPPRRAFRPYLRRRFVCAVQYFRKTPMTRPWIWTSLAETMMGFIFALEG